MDKDAYIIQLENRIHDLEKQGKDVYTAQLEATVEKLQKQVDNLTDMIILFRKQKFGSSSEKTPSKEGQLNLFNEAEVYASPDVPEPIVKDTDGYRLRKSKTRREEIIKDLPVREDLCTCFEEDLFCENCGTELKPIGKK